MANSKSDVISFGGVAIPSGVTGTIDVTGQDPSVEPSYQDRFEASSLYLTSTRPPTDIVGEFKTPTYANQAATLAWLGFPDNSQERNLRIYGGDPASLQAVETDVTVVDVRVNPGEVRATFRRGDPVWTEVSTTTLGPTSFSATGTTTFDVTGEVKTNPLIKIGWSANRPSTSATVGWKYRRRISVTNNSTQSLHNQTVQLGPINTATLITNSKLQNPDCQDLVVFDERGTRLRRLVAGTNTRGTFLTFVVDELAAGATRWFDVAYGNASATHDATNNGFPYTYPGSPTIDITAIDGTATAGTSSTMSTGVAVDPNRFNSATIILTKSATNVAGQYRRVSSHTTPGVYTTTRNFTSNPTSATRYVVISGPFMGDGGQASATSSTTLTDASQSWQTNEWIGATVEIITLDTDMGTVINTGSVTGNTPTALTVTSWGSGTPGSTALYRVYKRNANYIYRVDQTQRSQTNHRGRWRPNKGQTKPTQIWTASDGAPHAWSPTVYNPKNASNDFNQERITATDIGGGDIDYFAVLNASLARKDGARLREEGFANAVELTVPLGILGIRMDYAVKNPGGMARAFFGCRERGGEDWEAYHEYSSTQASLTARPTNYYDLTQYGTPLHLIAALTSDDDADVAKSETGTANLTDNTVLEVRVDSRYLVVTDFEAAAEDEVYDLTLLVRRDADGTENDGDDLIRIGQSEQHLFLATGEKLWVGAIGDVPLACRIYNGSTYVRDVPWPVGIYHVANDATGDVTRYVSSDVLPLTPGSQSIKVSDPDGSLGTVTLEVVYHANYI